MVGRNQWLPPAGLSWLFALLAAGLLDGHLNIGRARPGSRVQHIAGPCNTAQSRLAAWAVGINVSASSPEAALSGTSAGSGAAGDEGRPRGVAERGVMEEHANGHASMPTEAAISSGAVTSGATEHIPTIDGYATSCSTDSPVASPASLGCIATLSALNDDIIEGGPRIVPGVGRYDIGIREKEPDGRRAV